MNLVIACTGGGQVRSLVMGITGVTGFVYGPVYCLSCATKAEEKMFLVAVSET
jgi:hypothetical protein